MEAKTVLTDRFAEALKFAAIKHQNDYRKSQPEDPWPEVPYISHPMSVAALVLEYRGTEDQTIGALFHDIAEDHGGEEALAEISDGFGETVAEIVRNCSDALPEEGTEKPDWWVRKRQYIQSLEDKPPDALFVSCADKLHNARSILFDQRRLGNVIYKRFNPGRDSAEKGREATLWYYGALSEAFSARLADEYGSTLADELRRTVRELEDSSSSTWSRLLRPVRRAFSHQSRPVSRSS